MSLFDLDTIDGADDWAAALMLATSMSTAVTILLGLWLANKFGLLSATGGAYSSAGGAGDAQQQHLQQQLKALQDRVLDLELSARRVERHVSAPAQGNVYSQSGVANSFTSPSRDSPSRSALRTNTSPNFRYN